MADPERLQVLSDTERAFVDALKVARMATADRDGAPHVVPICFVVKGDTLYVTVDEKPKQATARPLKRLRNITENQQTAVIIDRYSDDWNLLGWVMLRGRAEVIGSGEEHERAQAALRERYPPYRDMQLEHLPVIALRISRVTSWGNLDVDELPSGGR